MNQRLKLFMRYLYCTWVEHEKGKAEERLRGETKAGPCWATWADSSAGKWSPLELRVEACREGQTRCRAESSEKQMWSRRACEGLRSPRVPTRAVTTSAARLKRRFYTCQRNQSRLLHSHRYNNWSWIPRQETWRDGKSKFWRASAHQVDEQASRRIGVGRNRRWRGGDWRAPAMQNWEEKTRREVPRLMRRPTWKPCHRVRLPASEASAGIWRAECRERALRGWATRSRLNAARAGEKLARAAQRPPAPASCTEWAAHRGTRGASHLTSCSTTSSRSLLWIQATRREATQRDSRARDVQGAQWSGWLDAAVIRWDSRQGLVCLIRVLV